MDTLRVSLFGVHLLLNCVSLDLVPDIYIHLNYKFSLTPIAVFVGYQVCYQKLFPFPGRTFYSAHKYVIFMYFII